MQLLLGCARARLDPAEVEPVRQALAAPIDWARLSQLAGRHKMLPLVYSYLRALADSGGNAPGLEYLRAPFVENAAHALQLTGQLLQVLRLFEAEGIPAVPYKGPMMAAQLYGNVALRQAGDLDILIRKRDVLRARALLVSRGFSPRYALTDAMRQFRFTYGYCEDFRSPSGVLLELHWGFTNGDVRFPVVLEDLLPRLETVEFGGTSVLNFASEDLLLILCVHGAKHRWDRLEWLCGVAELLRTPRPLEWQRVLGRAAELGCRRTLLVGVSLAHDLLGAPLPAQLLHQARGHRRVAVLAEQLRDRLLAEDAQNSAGFRGMLARDLYLLRLRDSARDRLRYLWHRCTRRVARAHRPREPLPVAHRGTVERAPLSE